MGLTVGLSVCQTACFDCQNPCHRAAVSQCVGTITGLGIAAEFLLVTTAPALETANARSNEAGKTCRHVLFLSATCYRLRVLIAITVPATNNKGPVYTRQFLAALHGANPKRHPVTLRIANRQIVAELTSAIKNATRIPFQIYVTSPPVEFKTATSLSASRGNFGLRPLTKDGGAT